MTHLLSLERHNNITKLCVKVKYFLRQLRAIRLLHLPDNLRPDLVAFS